jgi:hypothetical protein
MRFFRIVAYFVLLTVVLQLTDGPFIVHNFERSYLQQQFDFMPAQGARKTDAPRTLPDPHYSHGSIDEVLTDLADLPMRIEALRMPSRRLPGKGAVLLFASITKSPLERPPSFSLS